MDDLRAELVPQVRELVADGFVVPGLTCPGRYLTRVPAQRGVCWCRTSRQPSTRRTYVEQTHAE